MKLRNRFKDEDKMRVWLDHMYCAKCKSNQNCSLHHIDGCKKPEHASIYNSIMLCHVHHKEADAHNTDSPASIEFRKWMREYTYNLIQCQGRNNTKTDEEYLANNRTY